MSKMKACCSKHDKGSKRSQINSSPNDTKRKQKLKGHTQQNMYNYTQAKYKFNRKYSMQGICAESVWKYAMQAEAVYRIAEYA